MRNEYRRIENRTIKPTVNTQWKQKSLIQVQIKLKHKRDHKKLWKINTGGCKVGICAEISDY